MIESVGLPTGDAASSDDYRDDNDRRVPRDGRPHHEPRAPGNRFARRTGARRTSTSRARAVRASRRQRGRETRPRQARSIKAVAEIAARQQALDGDVRRRRLPRVSSHAPSGEARCRCPHSGEPSPPVPPPAPEPERVFAPWPKRLASADIAPEAPVDISGLQEQLREMTARIEALRPSNELENGDRGASRRSRRDRPLVHRSAAAARAGVARDRSQSARPAHRSQPPGRR